MKPTPVALASAAIAATVRAAAASPIARSRDLQGAQRIASEPRNVRAKRARRRYSIAACLAGCLDGAIALVVIALLAFMPLALGVVEAWSEFVATALGAALAVLLAVRLLWRGAAGLRSWALVPVASFVALAFVQLTPLPAAAVRTLSPATAATKSQLLSDLSAGPADYGLMTLSFYPRASRHDLRLVLLASLLLLAVMLVFTSPRRIMTLLAAAGILGGGLAILALAQNVTGAGGIYWRIPVDGPWWSGTFVNHSDFAQHMNLSIGAAMGLLLTLATPRSRREAAAVGKAAKAAKSAARWTAIALLGGMVVLGVLTIILSGARGGAAAVVVAGLFVALILLLRRGLAQIAWVALALACLALGATLFFGFDRAYDRLATLRQSKEYAERINVVSDLWGVWKRFPVFGTGLGTHETFYPAFNSTRNPGLYTHAENEYAQAAEETGLIGLAAVLIFVGLVWRDWWRGVGRAARGGPPVCAAAAGLGYGLLAAQVQSLSSFGQHLPAIAGLSAVTCGLIINLARLPRSETAEKAVTPHGAQRLRARERLGPALLAAILLATGAWAVADARAAWQAAGPWSRASAMADVLSDRNWNGTNGEYADLLAAAQAAGRSQPQNVQYRFWTDVYRWHALDRPGAPGGENKSAMLSAIVRDLNDARRLCPTFGPIYTFVGQIELYVLHRPIGAAHLRTAATLAPHDAVACFAAGSLDARAGLWEDARKNFARVLIFDRSQSDAILDLYLSELRRPDLVAQIAPDDPRWLLLASRRLSDKPLAEDARRQALVALRWQSHQSGLLTGNLAMMAGWFAGAGDYADAADALARADAAEPGHADWRLARAQALVKLGRPAEASDEALVALHLQPDLQAARALIQQINGVSPPSR